MLCPLRSDIRKIGTIQRRLAWPLHKDDTLFQSGRPSGLNIYSLFLYNYCPFGWLPTTLIYRRSSGRGTYVIQRTLSVLRVYSYFVYVTPFERTPFLPSMRLAGHIEDLKSTWRGVAGVGIGRRSADPGDPGRLGNGATITTMISTFPAYQPDDTTSTRKSRRIMPRVRLPTVSIFRLILGDGIMTPLRPGRHSGQPRPHGKASAPLTLPPIRPPGTSSHLTYCSKSPPTYVTTDTHYSA